MIQIFENKENENNVDSTETGRKEEGEKIEKIQKSVAEKDEKKKLVNKSEENQTISNSNDKVNKLTRKKIFLSYLYSPKSSF